MRLLFVIMMMISLNASAQCKTYKLGVRGDTLNCTDQQNLKQGKWVMHYDTNRGEPGFEEEGEYRDGKKEGLWRRYSLEGDIVAIENYKFGFKNGISQYFNLAGILREESWKAIDPKNPYDTIEVPDPLDPKKVEMKVIKLEGTTVKHGMWKYYNAGANTISKVENYVLGTLEVPGEKKALAVTTTSDSATVKKAPPKVVPKEVADYEKKNSGKKKIKVRDGKTGG